jgi:hypothetical protein
MSVNDLKTMGHSLGFSDALDNYRSMVWYDASGNNSSGNGLTNNRPYIANGGNSGGFDQQIAVQAKQNTNCVNGAIQNKISRCRFKWLNEFRGAREKNIKKNKSGYTSSFIWTTIEYEKINSTQKKI